MLNVAHVAKAPNIRCPTESCGSDARKNTATIVELLDSVSIQIGPCDLPQTTMYKWLFHWDDSKSLYRKWLFGVPGVI